MPRQHEFRLERGEFSPTGGTCGVCRQERLERAQARDSLTPDPLVVALGSVGVIAADGDQPIAVARPLPPPLGQSTPGPRWRHWRHALTVGRRPACRGDGVRRRRALGLREPNPSTMRIVYTPGPLPSHLFAGQRIVATWVGSAETRFRSTTDVPGRSRTSDPQTEKFSPRDRSSAEPEVHD